MYSLRRVLAVRFSLTLFIALGLIALWAMLGVQSSLRRQIDRALAGMIELQQARIAAGESFPRGQSDPDFLRYFDEGTRLLVMRDAGGKILESSASPLNEFP